MSNEYYIDNVIDYLNRGWLESELLNGVKIAIPYLMRVELLESNREGQIIRLLESNNKGQIVKIPYYSKTSSSWYSYLSNEEIKYSEAILKINLANKRIYIGNKSAKLVLPADMARGVYYLGFPVKRNKYGKNNAYINENKGGSRFSSTWFPFLVKNEVNVATYLHYGKYSDGCVTIMHDENMPSSWTSIYMTIIKSRIDENHLSVVEIE